MAHALVEQMLIHIGAEDGVGEFNVPTF